MNFARREDTRVEMALNPEEIENMDSETMAIRAEAALRSVALSFSSSS